MNRQPGDGDFGLNALMAQWRSLRDRQSAVAGTSQPLGSPPALLGANDVTVALTGVQAQTALGILNAEPGKYEITVPEATLIAHPAPELLVGVDLVLKGDRNGDGVIIEAVSPVWRRFLDELTDNPEAFWKLDPWQTEELIAGAWRENGFQVTLTPRSGDKGRDVIAYRDDIGAVRFLDQVRRYKPGHVVDAEAVRAMWGVLDFDRKASKAYVTTTSTFAPGVYKEFAGVMPTRLELRDGTQLREWLTRIAKR